MRPTPGVYLESIEVHDQTIDIWDILDPYKDSSRIIERGDGSPFLFWKYLDNGWISLNNLLTCCHRGVYINTFGRIIIFPSGVVTARVIDGDIQTILCENGTEYLIDEDGNKLSEVYHQDAKSYTNPC